MNRRDILKRGALGALVSLWPWRKAQPLTPQTPAHNNWVGRWMGGHHDRDFNLFFTRPGCERSGCLCGREFRAVARDRKTGEISQCSVRAGEGESLARAAQSALEGVGYEPFEPGNWDDVASSAAGLKGAWTALYAKHELVIV